VASLKKKIAEKKYK